MPLLHELVASPGVLEVLQHLQRNHDSALHRPSLEEVLANHSVGRPTDTIDSLLSANLLTQVGVRLALSAHGQRVLLLIEAVNGGDIHDIYRRLRRLDGLDEMYELVREGMTSLFFKSLVDRPGFGELYICSPWINPSEKEQRTLRYAMLLAERSGGQRPRINIVTRPADMMPPGCQNGLRVFNDLDASISYNRKVHSKLYIREPGLSGGYSMAIVGSENLTRSSHLELGIKISGDSRLIDHLIGYFLQVAEAGSEDE